MKLPIIKISLAGALLSLVVFIVGYVANLGMLSIGSYVLMFAFLGVAGLMATFIIFNGRRSEKHSEKERSKIRVLTIVSIALLIDFQFLLYFLGQKGFFSELSTTDPLFSKVFYAALCIGSGISGALMVKTAALEYRGFQRYAQLNWTVRLSYLLIWFCIWSFGNF